MGNTRKDRNQIAVRAFDLTSEEGLSKALEYAKRLAPYMKHLFPVQMLMLKLIDKGLDTLRDSVDTTPTIEAQAKAAVEVIKAGRASNASSVEVTLDQKAGIHLGSEIDGIPLKFSIGKSGEMTIKVAYESQKTT